MLVALQFTYSEICSRNSTYKGYIRTIYQVRYIKDIIQILKRVIALQNWWRVSKIGRKFQLQTKVKLQEKYYSFTKQGFSLFFIFWGCKINGEDPPSLISPKEYPYYISNPLDTIVQDTMVVLSIYLIHVVFSEKLQPIKLQPLKIQLFSTFLTRWQLNQSKIVKIKSRQYMVSILEKEILGEFNCFSHYVFYKFQHKRPLIVLPSLYHSFLGA